MNLDTGSNQVFVAREQHLDILRPERRGCIQGSERWDRCPQASIVGRVFLVRVRQILNAARRAATTTLNWLVALPYDSRDRLHSKEYELAMLGLSWVSDPVHDAALAQEIETARQQRQASDVALGDAAWAHPGPYSPTTREHRSVSISMTEPNHADVTVRD